MNTKNTNSTREFTPNEQVLNGYLDLIYPILMEKYWFGPEKISRDKVFQIFKEYVINVNDRAYQIAMSSRQVLEEIKGSQETIESLARYLAIHIRIYFRSQSVNIIQTWD